jgi:hypothetical protein
MPTPYALCDYLPNLVTKLYTVTASDEEVPQSHDSLIDEADVPRSSVRCQCRHVQLSQGMSVYHFSEKIHHKTDPRLSVTNGSITHTH